MKFKSRLLSLVFVLFVCALSFVGCAESPNLKKASKGLTSYAIDAVFCDEEKKLTAVEKVDYVNNKETILNTICFNVYGKAFSEPVAIKPYSKQKILDCFPNGVNYGDVVIKSVLVNNKVATFNFVGVDKTALEVVLFEPLYADERVEIVIEFELFLANCTHRLGYNENSVNLGNWYPIAAVFEKGEFVIDPYYANGDPFYSECANYEVSLAYPEKYTLASSGEKVDCKQESGVVYERFKALASRDFAMCLATDFEVKTAEVGDTLVSVYAYKDDGNANAYLETAIKTITLFNELFGTYPYKTLSVVFTDFFQGGMEYPSLVYISDSVEELIEIKKVIVHEIAHEWWYGVVGNNEVVDAWFDEGLAEYSTLLYFENYPEEGVDSQKLVSDTIVNYELYLDVVKSLNIKINYAMDLPVSDYSTEYEYVYMIYVKGLLFFNNLRTTMGDSCFFKFLKSIYKNYAFDIITKELFIVEAEKFSGVDMEKYLEDWLGGKVDISQN